MIVSDRSIRRLSTSQALGYSLGNFGKNTLWNTIEFSFLFFLTEITGFDPATAGMIIVCAMVCDALLLPCIGYFADTVRTRWGKYGPFLLLGSPLCGLCFVGLFAVPLWSEHVSPVLMMVFLFLFRLSHTLVDVPHNAMIARISSSSHERTKLSGMRFFFSSIASIAIASSLAVITHAPNGPKKEHDFFNFSIVVSIVAVISLWISWWSVRHSEIDAATPPPQLRQSFFPLVTLFKNRAFLVMLAVVFVTGLTTPVFTKLLLYYGKYALESERWGAHALTAFAIGSSIAVWAWISLAGRWEKALTLQTAHILVAAGSLGFFVLAPRTGLQLLMTAALIGAAAAGAYMLIWAMASDVVDNNEWKTGVRLEASIFAVLILAMKIAIGLGSGLVGAMLGLASVVPGGEQLPTALHALRMIMCGIPMLGSLLIVLILSAYRITHQHHAAALECLSARKQLAHN